MESAKQTNSNVEYTNLAVGEHEGRLVYVADLGMQEREYMGEVKPPAKQLSLGIEVMGNAVDVDGTMRPRLLWSKPFNVFKSMNERGIEYKYYKAFDTTAAEGSVADWEAMLGMPVNVIVKHHKAGDRTYDNIDTLAAIPSKYHSNVAPTEFTDACVGDCSDENNSAQRAMFGLAKFVFDKRIKGGAVSPRTATAAVSEADTDLSEDIPF